MIRPNDWTSDDDTGGLLSERDGFDVFASIRNRLGLLVAMTLVGVGAGYWATRMVRPVYESSAQILILKKSATIPSQSADQSVNEDNEVSGQLLANQAAIIQSPLIAALAVKKHNLQNLKTFAGTEQQSAAIVGGLSLAQGGSDMSTREANVLSLSYGGHYAEECQLILNAIIDAYRDFQGETIESGSQKTIGLIKQAKDVLQTQLNEKEQAYIEFVKSASYRRSDTIPDRGNIHEQRLAQIDIARAALEVRRAEVTAHIRSIEEASKRGDSQAALQLMVSRQEDTGNAGRHETAKRELLTLKAQEQTLLQDFGPDNPAVLTLRSRIRVYEQVMLPIGATSSDPENSTSFFTVYLDSRRQEIKELQRREQELGVSFEREQSAADAAFKRARTAKNELMVHELKDKTFLKDIERTEELFDAVLNGLQEVSLVKDLGGFQILVVFPPGVGQLVSPKMTTFLPIGGLVGLAIALALALMLDASDKSYHSPREIENQLRFPVIGHMPSIARSFRAGFGKGDQKTVSKMVCTWHQPNSHEAEEFRTIAAALAFGKRAQGRKILQITSPDRGDGKSTLAANLSTAMALTGKRVLLIDADWRNPSLQNLFAVDANRGLSTVLSSDEVTVNDVIQSTAIDNLSIIPSGQIPQRPAEMIASQQFDDLLKDIRTDYDFILIDTPPLLAVSDPATVAPRVDGVLLSIRMGNQVRAQSERSVNMLINLGAEIVGLIVNNAGRKSHYEFVAMSADRK